MGDDSIEIHVEQIDDVTCVTLVDLEIPIAYLEMMQREIMGHLDGNDGMKIIVDFGQVLYLPTPALGAMVNIHTQTLHRGGQLCLVGLSERLTEMFHVSKLDQLFSIHADVDSAMTSMGS